MPLVQNFRDVYRRSDKSNFSSIYLLQNSCAGRLPASRKLHTVSRCDPSYLIDLIQSEYLFHHSRNDLGMELVPAGYKRQETLGTATYTK